MSENNIQIASKIARLLRSLAKIIEANPQILNDLKFDTSEILLSNNRNSNEKKIIEPNEDIFTLFSNLGRDSLTQKLQEFDLSMLVVIVKKNGLDPTKKVIKWKNRDKLIDFIIERIIQINEKEKCSEI